MKFFIIVVVVILFVIIFFGCGGEGGVSIEEFDVVVGYILVVKWVIQNVDIDRLFENIIIILFYNIVDFDFDMFIVEVEFIDYCDVDIYIDDMECIVIFIILFVQVDIIGEFVIIVIDDIGL